jgi:hypothetical protein
VITYLTKFIFSRGILGTNWMRDDSGTHTGLITDADLCRTFQLHGPQELPDITAAQMATPLSIFVTREMPAAGGRQQ